MPEPAVDDPWRKQICATFGEAGAAWLARLPALLAEYADRWSLTVLPPFAGLSYHYVAPVVRSDGSPAVLKLGVPHAELFRQVEALRLYDGRGMVRLLEADPAAGVLLLEHVRPGVDLSRLPDERALEIAAGVMRAFWRPAPASHGFPDVATWAGGVAEVRAAHGGGTGPLPRRLVERAEGLFAELIPSQAEPVLLHGDLHHYNILSSERDGWLAIDPKGVIGEPAYETGALLRNPMPQVADWPGLPRILSRRVELLAEPLELDRERIRGWGLAQAVLSAVWSVEDGGDWRPAIRIAEALAAS